MRVFRSLALGVIISMLGGEIAVAQVTAPAAPPITLTSPGYADGGIIPDKYTLAVPSPVSPALNWGNVPAGAVSFALIMHDPEAVSSKSSADYLHWIAFNIPATARSLTEGVPGTAQMPDGTVQANNHRGEPGYMGPGAKNIYHHYTIELYALDAKLNLGPDATRAQLLAAMDGHVIAKGVLVGRFHR